MRYELHPYDCAVKALPSFEIDAPSERSAIGRAGTVAKRNNGPVDVARVDGGDWSTRYVTTVSPSEYHAHGYSEQRIA